MRQSSLATLRADKDRTTPTRPATDAGTARVLAERIPAPMPTLTSPAPPLASSGGDRLSFGGFVLAPDERRLTRNGVPIELGGRSFDLLMALVEQPGRVIPKRELLRRVWPDVTVEDVALRFHMTRLRKALDDGHDGRRLITTQVGVGYGFVGVIRRAETAPTRSRERQAETGLPGQLDNLIGRERDLRSLIERASGVRLLTIVGPPGVGKTSLAVEVAHALAPAFTDGATFIDLAAIHAPDMLIPAIAAALGLTAAANSPVTIILDHLRARRQLIVLDGGEHLVQALAGLCEQIAATAPDVRVITTSRQALRARNEHVHRLAPHDGPAAIALFRHHFATAGGAADPASEDASMIADICEHLDGLALPIELAALRAATHGIEATSKMFGDRLCLSWPGRRTASPRQRTLGASLDWSLSLLSATELEVLDYASRLEGYFSPEKLLATMSNPTSDHATISATLDELADKSLIFVESGRYRCPGAMRLQAQRHPRPLEA